MTFALVAVDHVQLALPPGREADAEHFYVDVLGMRVLEKPATMARRGGRWFEAPSGLQLHMGAEQGFRPAKKAHPALRVSDLDDLAAALVRAGHHLTWNTEIEGTRRFHTDDPFGNRLEFLESATVPAPRTEEPVLTAI